MIPNVMQPNVPDQRPPTGDVGIAEGAIGGSLHPAGSAENVRLPNDTKIRFCNRAISTNAGSELLKEVEELRKESAEKSDNYRQQSEWCERLVKELNAYKLRAEQWEKVADELAEAIYNRTPSKNCSCHICPPCSDCVEYGQSYNALSAYTTLKQTEGTK